MLTNIKNPFNSARKPFPLNRPAAVKSCSPNQAFLLLEGGFLFSIGCIALSKIDYCPSKTFRYSRDPVPCALRFQLLAHEKPNELGNGLWQVIYRLHSILTFVMPRSIIPQSCRESVIIAPKNKKDEEMVNNQPKGGKLKLPNTRIRKL